MTLGSPPGRRGPRLRKQSHMPPRLCCCIRCKATPCVPSLLSLPWAVACTISLSWLLGMLIRLQASCTPALPTPPGGRKDTECQSQGPAGTCQREGKVGEGARANSQQLRASVAFCHLPQPRVTPTQPTDQLPAWTEGQVPPIAGRSAPKSTPPNYAASAWQDLALQAVARHTVEAQRPQCLVPSLTPGSPQRVLGGLSQEGREQRRP